MKKIRWGLVVAAAAVLVIAQFGAAPSANSATKRITMKGGQIRGAYNRWTSAYAIYLTKEIKGLEVSSESSTGSSENVRAVTEVAS